MAEKISFIGLGLMGYPMAGHLASAGHRVRVYNRTRSKAESWVAEHGGALAATPAQAAEGADFVFACVGNDDDVRQVTLGEAGAFRALGAGAVFVDHTTDSAILARQLEAAARRGGFGFLDAPVSGGQSGAEQGVLSVMVGGDRAAFEVISKGAAQSWQMDNRHETMLEGRFDFGFAVEWMRKDLALALEEARRNGAHLPVAALVDQFYAEVQSLGGNRWDTSSLFARLEALRRAREG
jgi:3-hydroxyisobutyrate dehydrogenase